MEKFEKDHVTIVFNVFYAKKEKIYPAYVSKHKSNHEKQVIILMVSNGETHKSKSKGRSQQWNYLAVKKLSPLIRGIISRSYEDFSCLNCPYSFATEKKLNHIKKYLKIKIFVIKLCIRRTLKY